MTEERVGELMSQFSETEYLKFERIPEAERRHRRPDICAMLLLDERFPGKRDMVSSASHDQIWFDARPKEFGGDWPLSEADILYLVRCGFRWDDGGFCSLV